MNPIRTAYCLVLAVGAAAAGPAIAQTGAQTGGGPPAPGRMANADAPQSVALLFALQATGATLQGDELVLTGVSPSVVAFSDRPLRAAGHARTATLLEAWRPGDEIAFDKVPPNATVSVLDKAKGELATAVVVLKSPRLDGDRLTFTVEKRDGDIAGANGPASVFIDVVNVPLARLTTRQGGWYAGAK